MHCYVCMCDLYGMCFVCYVSSVVWFWVCMFSIHVALCGVCMWCVCVYCVYVYCVNMCVSVSRVCMCGSVYVVWHCVVCMGCVV
jgi:hypothetical protein